jgi:hypothetical protein
MALLFMDSFDHYATADITSKWSALLTPPSGTGDTSGIAAVGRHTSNGWKMSVTGSSSGASKQLALAPAGIVDPTTLICGFAINPVTPFSLLSNGVSQAVGAGNPSILCTVRTGAGEQFWIRLDQAGTLSVFRTSNLVGTTSGGLVQGAYNFVEIRAVISTSGQITIRINGVQVLALTAVNIAASGGTTWSELRLGYQAAGAGVSHEWDFDDLYLLDGSGAAPWNAFLGDVRVDARLPTAPGATTGWTPSAGANWQNVDDAAPNGDTDYNSGATAPLTDTFVVQDAPVVGAPIFGVQHNLSLKKMDAGICSVCPVVRHGGTDYVGSDVGSSLGYNYGRAVQQVNPGTGVQWLEADFNAAEFGYKKTV